MKTGTPIHIIWKGGNIEENIYYVYEHRRLDNGTCIYVGKGHCSRAYKLHRNKIHDKIMKDIGIKVCIIKSDLTEDDAFKLEHETVLHYVFDLGYGIDIDGYRGDNKDLFLTNKTFGGKGFTDMKRPKHSIQMSGNGNPMYGINIWDTYTKEEKEEKKSKISASSSGENKPMFGVSPKDRMSEDKYIEWKNKTVQRLSSQTGSNNPNSKSVYMYKDGNLVKHFQCIKDCALYMIDNNITNSKLNSVSGSIGSAIRNNKNYLGYKFHCNKLYV